MSKRKERIRCPKCGWEPDGGEYWQCDCGHVWDTFSTYGKCPACHKVHRYTQCIACHEVSLHHEWYIDDVDISDILKEVDELSDTDLKGEMSRYFH